MRVLQRTRRRPPRAKTIGPATPYLARGADEARRLAHNYVGTEHILLALVRDADGGAVRLLGRLAVTPDAIEQTLTRWLGGSGPPETSGLSRRSAAVVRPAKIDPRALAALGIDFDAVRTRLEQTFGPGALEQTRSACLAIAPRLKLALAYALDLAAGEPLLDEHVLLGMLRVPESVAARVLGELGVTFEAAQAVAATGL
jgi:ATP-dependent Clp protease ATP-binding subunit ClpA